MFENARIFNTNLIIISVVSLRSQFDILEKSAKKNMHCFCKMLYWRCLTGLGIWFAAWIWHGWEYGSPSKYARIFYIPGFSICHHSQHTSALNIWGLWIYYSSKYARVLNILDLHWPLNVPEYLWIVPEYVWLCHSPRTLNTSLILSPIVSLKSQFVIFENSAKINLHFFHETHYRRFLT